MAVLIDSCTTYNVTLPSYATSRPLLGQSFHNTNNIILNSASFRFYRSGNPTGNIDFRIYAHSGVYGTSSVPTGSALAISDFKNISSVSDADSIITLPFSGANKITLIANTNYCVVLNNPNGDSSNYLRWAYWNGNVVAGNNFRDLSGLWIADNSKDMSFYVYGDDPVTSTFTPKIILIN